MVMSQLEETKPPSLKEVIDSMLALMLHICNPCKKYATCTLDPPLECDIYKKEVENWRN